MARDVVTVKAEFIPLEVFELLKLGEIASVMRRGRNLSRMEMASLADVSVLDVIRLERDWSDRIKVDSIRAIFDALGYTVRFSIVGRDEEE